MKCNEPYLTMLYYTLFLVTAFVCHLSSMLIPTFGRGSCVWVELAISTDILIPDAVGTSSVGVCSLKRGRLIFLLAIGAYCTEYFFGPKNASQERSYQIKTLPFVCWNFREINDLGPATNLRIQNICDNPGI